MEEISKAKEMQAAEAFISMIVNSKEFAELKAASSEWLTVDLYIKGQYINWKTELLSRLECMTDKPADTTDSDIEEDPIPEEEEEYPTYDDYVAWGWGGDDDYWDAAWDEALNDALSDVLDDEYQAENIKDISTVALAERRQSAFTQCVEDLQKDPRYIMVLETGFIEKGAITFDSPFYWATINLPKPTNIAPCAKDMSDDEIKELYRSISSVFYDLAVDYKLQDIMDIGDRIILEFKGKKHYVCEFDAKLLSGIEVTKILERSDFVY